MARRAHDWREDVANPGEPGGDRWVGAIAAAPIAVGAVVATP